MGDKMPRPKKKKQDSHVLYWVAAILIIILFLKGFGVLKILFNIDPDGVTYSIDVGYITSAVLFGIVIEMFHKQSGTLSKQGERIARIEGIIESTSKKIITNLFVFTRILNQGYPFVFSFDCYSTCFARGFAV